MNTVTRNGRKSVRAVVLTGVSTLALVTMAAPVFAQTAPAAKADSDVVVVTGLRGSLQRAMNIKKNADGVVDGISAEDVGKYPDTNLADSLQRVPGVSINRVNGEGEQLTVRGFGPGYNSTTVDGRIMPASGIGVIGGGQGADSGQGNSRAFDFSNIASDGVGAVQVYKTGRADVASGGIGATVNVVTLQPLLHPGSAGSLTIKGLTNDHPGLGTVLPKKSITPEISGAYQWTDDSGKFGVALFGSHQEKTGSSRQDTVNNWNIETYSAFLASAAAKANASSNPPFPAAVITNAPTNMNQLIAVPSDSRLTYAEDDVKRDNAEVVLQWKPMENLTVTANTFYSQVVEQEARSELTNWFSAQPFAAVTFNGDPVIDSIVKVTDSIPQAASSPTTGKDQGYENELRSIKNTLQSTGLKVKYKPTDHWTLTFDISSSESQSGGNNADGSSSDTVSSAQVYVAQNGVYVNSTTYGNLAAPIQNYRLDPNYSPTHAQDIGSLASGYSNQFFSSQKDKIDEAKFDAVYQVDDDSKLSFGLDTYKNVNESAYQAYQAQFGDWGGLNPGDVQKYGTQDIKSFCMACQFTTVDMPTQDGTAYRYNAVTAYNGLKAYYGDAAHFANVLPAGHGSANTPHSNGFAHNKVEEDVKAGYAQFSMKSSLVGRPVKILAGVRYEDTNVTVTAYQNIPTGIRWDQKNNFSVIQGTGVQPYAVKSHYTNLLPSLDLAMNITDQLTGRMSFSITDARPQYSSLYATTSVSPPGHAIGANAGGIYTANSGNPSLKPLVSENFDASAEWYYGKNSYVSLGYYRKAVQNFIGNGTSQQNLFGLRDPSSGTGTTRSGKAATALRGLGETVGDNNLSAMTILVNAANGDVAVATDNYTHHRDPNGVVYADANALATALWGNSAWVVSSAADDPLAQFTVSQPVNNHTANIDGFEFSLQHFFGDTGFGVAASATTVNGDVALDNAADPGPNAPDQFALEGLSDTYNITGIYEKYGFEGRIVYNWRDKYLAQANASQHGGRYVAAFGQWDASLNYTVTPKVILSFEALNINKAHLVQYIRVPTNVLMYQELDSRYEFGVRYKF
ncbi:TonB-dependent receptor [Asticcacaulis solisilvae]|uniref:TonB-dependent receptor n=1 Tax=Asticcacaulis solisilvae TaxID=1217274 RepID=UPI003FD8680F